MTEPNSGRSPVGRNFGGEDEVLGAGLAAEFPSGFRILDVCVDATTRLAVVVDS